MHFLAGLMKRQTSMQSPDELLSFKVRMAGTPAGWITFCHQVQGISQPVNRTRAPARHQHRRCYRSQGKKKSETGGRLSHDLLLPQIHTQFVRLTIMFSKAPAPKGGAQSSARPM